VVFTFDPIEVKCDDDGITHWLHDEDSTARFIFHVRDTGNYQSAMTKAMKTILTAMP
jgi:hypothetical protein